MTAIRRRIVPLAWLLASLGGCATTKESDTARTGLEQLLVSSAVDRALDKVDLSPVRGAKVFVEEKYLDCVDKNYVLVALHQRLLNNGSTLADKADDADVLLQISSGGVGTDRQEKFVGVPEIPLAPPSPIMLPKLAIFSRTRANGTAKLMVVAYDAKSKRPVINQGVALARSDMKGWKFFGAGPLETGSVPTELAGATGENDAILNAPPTMAARKPLLKR